MQEKRTAAAVPRRPLDVLLDTNILVAAIVAGVDWELVGKHKRTRELGLEPADRPILTRLLELPRRVLVTPNILTETSNLLAQTEERHATRLLSALGRAVASFDERYVPSTTAVGEPEFRRLGLTDAGILALATSSILVVSNEHKLRGLLEQRGVQTGNFAQMRYDARLGAAG